MIDISTIEILLNLPTLGVCDVEVSAQHLTVHCRSVLQDGICPNCLQKTSRCNQTDTREVRDLPIAGKKVALILETRQFHCQDCNRYFQERFPFVGSSKTMTARYEKYIYECSRDSSIQRVCVQEDVVWGTVQSIFTAYSQKETAFLAAYQPKRIGIDEFAVKKGHNDFAVVIVDLDKGYALDVLDFRTKAEIIAYFEAKGKDYCAAIEVFSCDFWEGFINTAKEIFPNAAIVPDRFHLFKMIHEVLDKERKTLRKTFKNEQDYKSIKWLLFKAWEKLTQEQRKLLLKAFRKAPVLRNLYFLKNELRNIFEQDMTKAAAETHLAAWVAEAQKLNHNGLNGFLKTLNKHFNYILNFFTYRVSNGIVEGMNNVIKAIKRQGFGFRNFQNFKLKIQLKFI
jgi:transposase